MIADIARVVHMIGNRFDIVEHIRIKVLPRLSLVSSPLNHVIQMRNDTRCAESLPIFVVNSIVLNKSKLSFFVLVLVYL